MKQTKHNRQALINDVVIIDLVYNEVYPFKFHIGGLSNPQTILEKVKNDKIGSTKLSKDQLC